MDDLTNIFSLLSDKTRLRILLLLHQKKLCVCEIFVILDMAQPRISQQLRLLRQARLISATKDKKWSYYQIADNEYTNELKLILAQVSEWLKNDAQYQEDLKKVNTLSTKIKLLFNACCGVNENESN